MIKLIKEQKATMIVEHISYDQIDGEYDSTIFTAEKSAQTFDKAFRANKAIQDYVFTDGSAEKSIERRFCRGLGCRTRGLCLCETSERISYSYSGRQLFSRSGRLHSMRGL